MITYRINLPGLKEITKKLDDASWKAPTILKTTANETAKEAKKLLSKKANKTYIKERSEFTSSMKIKNGTYHRPGSTIHVKGEMNGILDFRVSPNSYTTGDDRPKILKGKLIRNNRMAKLQSGNIKAFITQFRNGHIAVVKRTGKNRFPIHSLYSIASPHMISSKKVYGVVQPQMDKYADQCLKKHMDTFMRGR